jgi:DivIVA domain-containing protein
MIELTPLDVRKKKGDFRRGIRGYESAQVDDFLDLVADRLEALVREASSLQERVARLEQQVADYRDREKALTEALVTAQQMREDIRTQSTREVEIIRKHAEQQATAIKADAVKAREREEQALRALRARQEEFLKSYRSFLESELGDLKAVARKLEPQQPEATEAARSEASPSASEPLPQPPEASVDRGASAPPRKAEKPPVGTTRKGAALIEDIESLDDAPWAEAKPREEARPQADRPRSTSASSTRAPESKKPEPPQRQSRGKSADEELDAQLAEALARWEPELEADKSQRSAPVDDDLDTDDAEEIELLLEDDDVVPVPPAKGKSAASPHARMIEELDTEEEEIDAELAELLGPDPATTWSARKPVPPPPAPPAPPRRDLTGEVNAAMGDAASDSPFIDLKESLGEAPPTPLRTPPENPLETVEAGFNKPVDESTDADEAATRSSTAKPIDLESYNNFHNYPSLDADTSGLTLHPMFFDQDSQDLPGLLNPAEEKRKEERGQRWSGGDK